MLKFHKISFIILLSLSLSAITLAAGNIVEALNDDEKEIVVFPNPVLDDNFNIKAKQEISEVVVLNLLGQKVYSQDLVSDKSVNVKLETTQKGIYIVQVKFSDGTLQNKRILIK